MFNVGDRVQYLGWQGIYKRAEGEEGTVVAVYNDSVVVVWDQAIGSPDREYHTPEALALLEKKPLSDQALADEYFRIHEKIKELVKERTVCSTTLRNRGYKLLWPIQAKGPLKFTKTIPPVPAEPIVVELLPPSS